MRLDEAEARALFAAARVARLASVRADGSPHLVPVCFAVTGDVVYTAVDHKPKRTPDLARLANIRHEPRVALLADRYLDDWSQLWWVRVDGLAREVADRGERSRAVTALEARYRQYRRRPPSGRVIAVDAGRWSGWKA